MRVKPGAGQGRVARAIDRLPSRDDETTAATTGARLGGHWRDDTGLGRDGQGYFAQKTGAVGSGRGRDEGRVRQIVAGRVIQRVCPRALRVHPTGLASRLACHPARLPAPCLSIERAWPRTLRVIQSAWTPWPKNKPNEREGSPVGLTCCGGHPPEDTRVCGGDPAGSSRALIQRVRLCRSGAPGMTRDARRRRLWMTRTERDRRVSVVTEPQPHTGATA